MYRQGRGGMQAGRGSGGGWAGGKEAGKGVGEKVSRGEVVHIWWQAGSGGTVLVVVGRVAEGSVGYIVAAGGGGGRQRVGGMKDKGIRERERILRRGEGREGLGG